ncbi:hypothetical protein GEMRC1_005654 [Eukaryota sp. GEM-RC1]
MSSSRNVDPDVICTAIQTNNIKRVSKLLASGVSPAIVHPVNGRNTLHYAVIYGRTSILSLLLEEAKRLSRSYVLGFTWDEFINHHDEEFGETPLSRCIQCWIWEHSLEEYNCTPEIYKDVFHLLVDAGACLKAKNLDGMTLLHYPVYSGTNVNWEVALDCVQTLLEQSNTSFLINVPDDDSETPFHTLFKTPDETLMSKIRDPDHSSTRNYLEIVRLFRKFGGRVSSVKTRDGYTPLELAFNKGFQFYNVIHDTLTQIDSQLIPKDQLRLPKGVSPSLQLTPSEYKAPTVPKLDIKAYQSHIRAQHSQRSLPSLKKPLVVLPKKQRPPPEPLPLKRLVPAESPFQSTGRGSDLPKLGISRRLNLPKLPPKIKRTT